MKNRLNWKHILYHFIGFWSFSHAFRLLGFLNNVAAAETIRLSKNDNEIQTTYSLSKLVISTAISFNVGYLVALCLCVIASRKVKGSHINTVISFMVFLIISYFGLTGWRYLSSLVLLPGSPFEGWLFYVINAVILIGVGLYFIFRVRRLYKIKDAEQSSILSQYT